MAHKPLFFFWQTALVISIWPGQIVLSTTVYSLSMKLWSFISLHVPAPVEMLPNKISFLQTKQSSTTVCFLVYQESILHHSVSTKNSHHTTFSLQFTNMQISPNFSKQDEKATVQEQCSKKANKVHISHQTLPPTFDAGVTVVKKNAMTYLQGWLTQCLSPRTQQWCRPPLRQV